MTSHEPDAHLPAPDPLDFHRLFDAHFDELARYAYRYVQSIDEAKDLVHDAFLRLWRQRDEVDFRTSVRAYLFTTVRHLALDHLRRLRVDERWRGSVKHSAGPEARIATDDPGRDLASREIAAAVEEAVAALPPRQREILRLRWHRHASYSEIAQALGISPRTVEHHVSRALTALRDTLRHLRD